MLRHNVDRGFGRAVALLGVITAALLFGPLSAAHAVSPSSSEYPPSVATTTDLRLEKSTVQPGESNTAYVSVRSDAGQPSGTVTITVAGRAPETVALVDGEATYAMPTDLAAGRTYKVIARYNGAGEFRTSRDVAYVTVADGDVAGAAGEGDDDAVARPATVAGDAAGLPNVGAEASTTAAFAAGVGLIAGGFFSLAMYRRRSHI